MKLEKISSSPEGLGKRWYDDACGTALALELIGERWSLLIVRELMFGGKRFSELRAGLPGISANVLTQRLARLVPIGVLRKRKLPPPASVDIYELTEWGLASETAIQELGRWAVKSPLHDPTLPLSAASLMMSLRTMHDGKRVGSLEALIGFRIGAEEFTGRIDRNEIAIQRDDANTAEATFEATPETIASIVYGGRPIAEAEASDDLRLTGDRALAERFVRLFVLPEKLA